MDESNIQDVCQTQGIKKNTIKIMYMIAFLLVQCGFFMQTNVNAATNKSGALKELKRLEDKLKVNRREQDKLGYEFEKQLSFYMRNCDSAWDRDTCVTAAGNSARKSSGIDANGEEMREICKEIYELVRDNGINKPSKFSFIDSNCP